MFRLHDRTRRRICVAGFFLLCILPTVLVAGWCVAWHLPGHVSAEARRLTRQLGLDVTLEGLRHLRPGVVLYEGLELADPETGRSVLRCRLLEARRTKTADQQGQPQTSLVLIASQPEIDSAGLDRLGRMLQRQTGRPEVDVRLAAAEATLLADENSQTLTDLQGGVESLPDGTQAQVSFRLAGIEMLEPIRIRIARNRQTMPPTTAFELDTGGGAVPCSVLAAGLPILEPLGSRSRFRGYIWANQTSDDRTSGRWNGEVTGQLLDVDLGNLVTDRFPHKLSGTGQVTIQSARFRRGRLEDASGTLAAGPGVISRSLMDAAVGRLYLIQGDEPQASGELVPYEQLALAFAIDSQGLRLQGRCSAGGTDAILVDRRSRLLGAPLLQPQPVVALLQALVPASEVQVPATRQTDWLMRHLPVPQVIRPEIPEGTLPTARVRLGRGKDL